MTDHLLRFRMKTDADLQAMQLQLEQQESVFVQQNMGSKGFTRDLRLLEEKLQAIAFVLRERGSIVITPPATNIGVGCVDFSNVQS